MEKRGISHIEVMLSFLIFIGFVIFALYFFSPFNTNRVVESVLDYAFREIKQETSVNIESYSIVIKTPIESGKSFVVEINSLDPNMKVRVENNKGEVINSKRDNKKVIFDWDASLYGPNPDKGFLVVKFSEDFELSNNPLSDETSGVYDISSSDIITVLSEKRIRNLADNYKSDYDNLKKKFNLPNRVNFEFELDFDNRDDNGDIISGKEGSIPKGVEIFSRRERVEVLTKSETDTGGNVEFADLVIRIW